MQARNALRACECACSCVRAGGVRRLALSLHVRPIRAVGSVMSAWRTAAARYRSFVCVAKVRVATKRPIDWGRRIIDSS